MAKATGQTRFYKTPYRMQRDNVMGKATGHTMTYKTPYRKLKRQCINGQSNRTNKDLQNTIQNAKETMQWAKQQDIQ